MRQLSSCLQLETVQIPKSYDIWTLWKHVLVLSVRWSRQCRIHTIKLRFKHFQKLTSNISSFTVSCKKKEILSRVFGATSATSATLKLFFPAGAIGRQPRPRLLQSRTRKANQEIKIILSAELIDTYAFSQLPHEYEIGWKLGKIIPRRTLPLNFIFLQGQLEVVYPQQRTPDFTKCRIQDPPHLETSSEQKTPILSEAHVGSTKKKYHRLRRATRNNINKCSNEGNHH